MTTHQNELLHKAMEPLGEVLTPFEELLKVEKTMLVMFPVVLLAMCYAALSETPGHLRYFPFVIIGVALSLFWSIRRYRKLKAFYQKVEDWPYTSKEALQEARTAILSRLPRLYSGAPLLYSLLPFSSFLNLFKEDSRQFFSNIFHLQNPFDGVTWYVPLLLFGVPALTIFWGKISHEKFLTKNYREPLNRLQEIIDRFDGA